MRSIPHESQRYETVGDWELKNNTLHIRVSDMQNDKYNVLVAIHELVEYLLCEDRGISDEVVTKFDMEFENSRLLDNNDEPGNDPKAPYHKEHVFATKIEKMLAEELGVDWDAYDKAVWSL